MSSSTNRLKSMLIYIIIIFDDILRSSTMKKILAIIMSVVCLASLAGCGKANNTEPEITASTANEALTDFFASYNKMSEYLQDSEISISNYTVDNAGLRSILKAIYQAKSVTFAFPEPLEASKGIFSTTVTVSSPDLKPLYDMYQIDRELAIMSEEAITEDFVAQSFYNNIRTGTTSTVSGNVYVTIEYYNGEWVVYPSDFLASAIFPNIDLIRD